MKKIHYKIVPLCIALILSITLFSGCGNKSTNEPIVGTWEFTSAKLANDNDNINDDFEAAISEYASSWKAGEDGDTYSESFIADNDNKYVDKIYEEEGEWEIFSEIDTMIVYTLKSSNGTRLAKILKNSPNTLECSHEVDGENYLLIYTKKN